MDILERAAAFRAELLREERRAASEMVRYYGEAWSRIQAQVDDLMKRIGAARARGEEISPAWLAQLDRMQSIERAVQGEIGRFAAFAEQGITALQGQAVEAAREHAKQLILGMGPIGPSGPVETGVSFGQLNTAAVTDLVGFLQDGSPLSTLLDELPGAAAAAVKKTLVAGVVSGAGPKVVARQIRGELGGNLARALTISRTEMMRSYRSASNRVYEANSTVLAGWIWTASLGSRTCAACIALHGREFPLDEPFGSHPNCRCSPIPKLKREELNPEIETGETWFARQHEEMQGRILGPAKLLAYRAKELKLSDLVGYRKDERWGPTRWEKSLKEALGAKRALYWRKKVKEPPAGSSGGPPAPKRKAKPTPTATPTPTPPPAPLEMVRTVEDQIRTNAGFEKAYAVDTHGTVILDKRGQSTSVSFTKTEVDGLKKADGVILTHNHPVGWQYPTTDPRHDGNSFSPQDIMLSCSTELAEIRAVTPTLRFSMKPGLQGWSQTFWNNTVAPSFQKHERDVYLESGLAIHQGAMTPEDAEARHFDEVWSRVANEVGLQYAKERG